MGQRNRSHQLVWACSVWFAIVAPTAGLAQGLLIPTDPKLGPLGLNHQRVDINIKEQVAITKVEQEFYNHTSQPLEADFVFPVPRNANVDEFAMWIDGKRTTGELLNAGDARKVYSDIVRRMKDPGLLERMEDGLFRVRVFPIPAQGSQKIEISYSEIVPKDAGVLEYQLPVRSTSAAVVTENDFSLKVTIESASAIKNIYSPTHAVDIVRPNDRQATVGFEQHRALLDKTFRLIWSLDDGAVGLTTLTHRAGDADAGYAMLLLTPSTALAKEQRVPRDLVFVLDTSGSMAGDKIVQAKKAIEHCLARLHPDDRFNIIRFSTTHETFATELQKANQEQLSQATSWVNKFEATGGTAIADALSAALDSRTDGARDFTIVFVTDGRPTIGITDPKDIIKVIGQKNSAATRIFSFGVGDNVNAPLLDQIAEQTRAVSVYVRPNEDIEQKILSFFDKISHPVLTNLKLVMGKDSIKLSEMYPPQLPDLFHGGQLVLLARYEGSGPTPITLEGSIGTEKRSYVFEANFPATEARHEFVPDLWAQRKIGFLLDQIRLAGESKELVDEITQLAKKFGIVTPYTSYLITPDEAQPVVNVPTEQMPITPVPMSREDFSDADGGRGGFGGGGFRGGGGFGGGGGLGGAASNQPQSGFALDPSAPAQLITNDTLARQQALAGEGAARKLRENVVGREAVQNAQVLADLKNADQNQAGLFQTQRVNGQMFQNVRGVWIDPIAKVDPTAVRVQYLSDAYFQLINYNRAAQQVLAQGDRVVWKTPTGKTLIIDGEGEESLNEKQVEEILGPKDSAS